MPSKYIQLDNRNVFNNQYLLTVFYVKPVKSVSLEVIAAKIASITSNGLSDESQFSSSFADDIGAIVYKIDNTEHLIYIAYPWRIFDRNNISSIMMILSGKLFTLPDLKKCRILDIWFPPQMLECADQSIKNLTPFQKQLYFQKAPLIAVQSNPQIGLSQEDYGDLAHNLWSKGVDIFELSEFQMNQDFCLFEKLIDKLYENLIRVEKSTQSHKVLSFSAFGSSYEEIVERIEYVDKIFSNNNYIVSLNLSLIGWSMIKSLKIKFPDTFFYCNNSSFSLHINKHNATGFSPLVLSKIIRGSCLNGFEIVSSEKINIKNVKIAKRLKHSNYIQHKASGLLDAKIDSPFLDELRQTLKITDPSNLIDEYYKLIQLDYLNEKFSEGIFFSQDWNNIKVITPFIKFNADHSDLKEYSELINKNCILKLSGTLTGILNSIKNLKEEVKPELIKKPEDNLSNLEFKLNVIS